MKIIAFPDKYARAYPRNPELQPSGVPCDVGDLLLAPFDTDVHFVAYATDLGCRLSIDLFDEPNVDKVPAANVRMVLAVFDVDDPAVHDSGQPARPEWWTAEKLKLGRLWEAHPNFFTYRSRGGYRIVFELAEAHELRCRRDEDAWKAMYLTWCRYLERRFGIAGDRACKDWTRHFRAPNVVRDGVRQTWETLGDPRRLGAWAPDLADEDRVAPKQRNDSSYGAVSPKQRDDSCYGAVEPVPIADPANTYGRARIASAVEYLRRAPLSIKGQCGRNTMFGVCAALTRRMRLPVDVAADLIEAIYNPRLATAGTATWSHSTPSRHGMSIVERLEQARTTGTIPAGNVLDEATWKRLQLGAVW
jgi:hypothetical protein